MSDDVDTGANGFLSSALLLAAVSAILLLGLFLKTDPRLLTSHAAESSPPPPVQPLALGSSIAVEPAPPLEAAPAEAAPPIEIAVPAVKAAPAPAPPDPVLVRLATRAEADCGRIAKAKGRFTAQLVVACKPETVDRLLAAGGSSAKLYVLPAKVKDESCFRVCFGSYASTKEAAAAADLPKTLHGKEKIGAVEIAKVLP
jgi:septal ring-binding cell division protein DamX